MSSNSGNFALAMALAFLVFGAAGFITWFVYIVFSAQ